MKKMYNVEAVSVTPAMIRGEDPWSAISMVRDDDLYVARDDSGAITDGLMRFVAKKVVC